MTTTTQQVTWGAVTMVFDNEEFRRGYALGRIHYFHGTPPDGVTGDLSLPVSSLLRVITRPTKDGHYQLDEYEEDEDTLELTLGVLVGYLSGPLRTETVEEKQAWNGPTPFEV